MSFWFAEGSSDIDILPTVSGLQAFWESVKKFFLDFYGNMGLNLLRTVTYLVLGLIVIKLVQKLVRKATLKNKKLDNSASVFIVSLVTAVLYVLLAIILIKSLGFSTATVIAGFSTVALAIILGLQDTMTSITNGIIIIFTHPFKAGDFVDIGGTTGTVKDIRLFNTKLLTPDNLEVIIPNSAIVNATMTNYSEMPLRRLDIVVPCPYSIDVDEVKTILIQTAQSHPNVVEVPAPFCRLTNYGASSVDFTVRVWVPNASFWDTKFDLTEQIFKDLRKNGIEIPFDQMDVHIIDMPKEGK